jgi:hypothetical protein
MDRSGSAKHRKLGVFLNILGITKYCLYRFLVFDGLKSQNRRRDVFKTKFKAKETGMLFSWLLWAALFEC